MCNPSLFFSWVILPWQKVYGHLAIKLIYWQKNYEQDQSWYSISSMGSLGMNHSGHALGHGFVKGFDVLEGDLSPDPSGDFFQPCDLSCMSAMLCVFDMAIFRWQIPLSLRAIIAPLSLTGRWVPQDIVKKKKNSQFYRKAQLRTWKDKTSLNFSPSWKAPLVFFCLSFLNRLS